MDKNKTLRAVGIALACSTLTARAAAAQQLTTGFLDRTVRLAGQEYRYQVYVPRDYSAERRWPVILFLHGA